MNDADWYTDLADVFRDTKVMKGSLTTHQRELVLSAVPCRIYRSSDSAPAMKPTAAEIRQTSKIAVDNAVDIRAGDEFIITRGGALGKSDEVIRGFAGSPNRYYEPFGAVIPGLAHQEIVLLEAERVK